MNDNSSNTGEPKRLAISDDLISQLTSEVARIRQSGSQFKVNESKLVNAIIERFFDRYIANDRPWLEKKFFDKRAYLRSLIDKSESDEALASSISEFIKTSKVRRPRSKRSTEPS